MGQQPRGSCPRALPMSQVWARNPTLPDSFGFSVFFVSVPVLGKQRVLLTAGPRCVAFQSPVQPVGNEPSSDTGKGEAPSEEVFA